MNRRAVDRDIGQHPDQRRYGWKRKCRMKSSPAPDAEVLRSGVTLAQLQEILEAARFPRCDAGARSIKFCQVQGCGQRSLVYS
jgi:hypothetical protein